MIASGVGHLGRQRLLQLLSPARSRSAAGCSAGRSSRSPGSRSEPASTHHEPGRVQGVAHRPGEAGAGRREDLVGADGDAGGVGQGDRGARTDARSPGCRSSASMSPEQPGLARRTTRRRPRPRSRPSRAPRRSRRGRAACGTCRRRPARPRRGCRSRRRASRPPGRTGTATLRAATRPIEPSRDRLHSAGVVRVVTSSQRTPGHADEEDRGRASRPPVARGAAQRRMPAQAQHQGEHRAAEHGRARAGRGRHRSSLRAHYPRPRRRCGVSVQRAHHLHGRDAMSEGAAAVRVPGSGRHVHRGRAASGRRPSTTASTCRCPTCRRPSRPSARATPTSRSWPSRARSRAGSPRRSTASRGGDPLVIAARDAGAGAVHARRRARGRGSRTSAASPRTRTRGCSAGAGWRTTCRPSCTCPRPPTPLPRP